MHDFWLRGIQSAEKIILLLEVTVMMCIYCCNKTNPISYIDVRKVWVFKSTRYDVIVTILIYFYNH